MQAFAERFYKSTAWQHTAQNYMKSVGGLCEECQRRGIYRPAEIVHHKIHITPANLEDPEIALYWGNLEALCRKCHGERHREPRRFTVDPESGRVEIPMFAENRVF